MKKYLTLIAALVVAFLCLPVSAQQFSQQFQVVPSNPVALAGETVQIEWRVNGVAGDVMTPEATVTFTADVQTGDMVFARAQYCNAFTCGDWSAAGSIPVLAKPATPGTIMIITVSP